MADTKITALTALTGADPANDVIPIVDVSDTTMAASGTTKKISVNNILGASGTATLASATITGDLTVKTNVLKVDTTNNRVGINKAIPVADLDVGGSGRFQSAGSNWMEFGVNVLTSNQATGASIRSVVSSAGNPTYSWTGDSDTGLFNDAANSIGFAIGGSEGMRLNSTGLGVGVSPSFKLHVQENASNVIARFTGSNANGSVIDIINTGTGGGSYKIGSNFTIGGAGEFAIYDSTAAATRLLISSTGNVGIGVTPSAWSTSASRKAIQISTAGSFSAQDTGTAPYTFVASNWVSTATGDQYILGSAAPATLYRQFNGAHSWFNAPSGTGALTFTQAMTLDASGRLYVGTTTSGGVNGFSIVPDPSTPTCVLNGNATTGGTAYLLYSTGAAANRFYVTYAGTVFAVNTTISAISDQRMKENVQDIDVGLDAILALKPRKFDWKEGKGKNIKGDRGFIAQEFEQVFPQLVDEWQDKTPEGEAPYKSVRQDLIPVLVKAIQELTARVQTLETR